MGIHTAGDPAVGGMGRQVQRGLRAETFREKVHCRHQYSGDAPHPRPPPLQVQAGTFCGGFELDLAWSRVTCALCVICAICVTAVVNIILLVCRIASSTFFFQAKRRSVRQWLCVKQLFVGGWGGVWGNLRVVFDAVVTEHFD